MPGEKRGPLDIDGQNQETAKPETATHDVATLDDLAEPYSPGLSRAEVLERLRTVKERRVGNPVTEINKDIPDNHTTKNSPLRLGVGKRSFNLKPTYSAQESHGKPSAEASKEDKNGTIRRILDQTDKGKNLDHGLTLDDKSGRRDIYILKLNQIGRAHV